jgi:hypothetical protein
MATAGMVIASAVVVEDATSAEVGTAVVGVDIAAVDGHRQ